MIKKHKSGTLLDRTEGWPRPVAYIVFLAIFLNAFGFTLARMNGACYTVDLVSARENPESGVVNYVMVGLLNQSEAVFEQFLPEFEGSVVYVNYNTHGWSPEVAAAQIVADINERQAEARIWTISVTSQVAHLVDLEVDDLKIVAINPCTTTECLAPKLRGYYWLACLLQGVGYSLGWFSALPVIPTAGSDTGTEAGRRNYSLILLFDQLVAITGGITRPGPYEAETVIVSNHDQLLDVAAQRELYVGSAGQILEIEADHAGTTVYAEAYREAFWASGLTK